MLELDTKIDALNIQSTTFKIHTLHDQLEKQHRERFEKYNKDILTKKKEKKLFRDKKAFQEERAYRWSDSYRASNLSNIYACAPYRTNNKTKIPQTPKFPTISQPALAPTNAHRRQKRSHPVNRTTTFLTQMTPHLLTPENILTNPSPPMLTLKHLINPILPHPFH